MRKKKLKLTREERIIEARKTLAAKEKVAAIWTRVSSADQYKSNYSIETQLNGCYEYCKRNGIRVKKEFGGENESAKEAGDLFLDMIGEVLADPEYNCIVVFDFDRFSRDSNDGIIYKTKVKRCGVTVKSVNQPIDSNNVLAEQIENILIIIADIDNAMRRHKCHEGMVNCINRGEWYSKPPLGYDSEKKDRHHVITVNDEGRIFKNAFLWLANEPGITQEEILQRLAAQGLVMKKEAMSANLKKPFYCGRLTHQYVKTDGLDKPYIMGVQEPLVSEEIFDRVQEILAGNHQNYEHAAETPNFPLKRFVYCLKDGHLMTGYTTKGKGYYKCPVKGCKTNISADEMHKQYSGILERYRMPEAIKPIFVKVLTKKFKDNENMNVEVLCNLKKNLATLNTKLKTVKMRYATGDIDKDIYEEAYKELTAEITHVEREIEKCDTKISNLSDFTKQSVEISSKLRTYWEQKDFKLCQKIQKLTFPEGIKWDAKNKAFRTDGENKFLAKIAFLGTSVEASIKEEPNKSCDLSGLVAEAGLEPTTSGL